MWPCTVSFNCTPCRSRNFNLLATIEFTKSKLCYTKLSCWSKYIKKKKKMVWKHLLDSKVRVMNNLFEKTKSNDDIYKIIVVRWFLSRNPSSTTFFLLSAELKWWTSLETRPSFRRRAVSGSWFFLIRGKK